MRLTIEGKPLLDKTSQKVVPKPHFSYNMAILAGFADNASIPNNASTIDLHVRD